MLARGTFFLLFLSAFSLAACTTGQVDTAQSSSAPDLSLIPYQTPTGSATIPAILQGVTPSPTPFIYIVAPNDTFFSIAARLNIDLNQLLAANPDVDPRVLIPGTELVIPVAGQSISSTSLPTLTPVAAQVNPPVCYSTASAELWCFMLVSNTASQVLENLTGEIQLIASNGKLLASASAVPPLDILEVGGRMPLVAYFSSPPADWASVSGRLLTGFSLLQLNENYLEAGVANVNWKLETTDKLSAHVQGSVQVQDNQSASVIWVLAVAYDTQGQVVGYRRWESAGELEFDFWVYSLGGEINEVEVLLEALP